MSDLADDLDLLARAAAGAGRIAMSYFRKDPQVSWKAGMSPVTEADLHADAYLKETLLAARPDYGWLSEETEDSHERLDRKRTFIVDPIDGTRAFIDGQDQWCVSLAVVEGGRSLAGVLDCPACGEVYLATRGGGASLNGKRLHMAAATVPLRMSGNRQLVAAFGDLTGYMPRHMPHIPSLAYRVARIADGRLDATFIKPNAHDWDLAAADLVLEEAGGVVLRADGARPDYGLATIRHGFLVAAAPQTASAMLGVVGQSAIG